MKKYNVAFIPEPIKDSRVIIPISLGRYNISEKKTEEYDAILKALFTHAYSLLSSGSLKQVDILFTGDLQRINWEDGLVNKIESHFFRTHQEKLSQLSNIYKWNAWLEAKQDMYQKFYQDVLEKSQHGSEWYNLMVKTHDEVRMSNDLELSLEYQRKEYAAIMLMQEYNYIIYTGTISLAWAYMYSIYSSLKLPIFSRAAFSGINTAGSVIGSTDAHHTTKLIVHNLEQTLSSHNFPKSEKEKLIKMCMSLIYAYGPKEMNMVNNDDENHVEIT